MMNRRNFLTTLMSTSPLLFLPFNNLWGEGIQKNKRLILIELKGGNDGLNTLIPYGDPSYYRLRPGLAIKKEKVLPIDEKLGLHPSLSFLHGELKKKNLAVFQGVGYPEPNLSHFRSIDIWETATDSHEYSDRGWLNPVLKDAGAGKELIKGLILGDNSFGPFRGATSQVLVMDNPKKFLRKNNKLHTYKLSEGHESLNHILTVENSLSHAMEEIREKTKMVSLPKLDNLPKDKIAGAIKAYLTIAAAGHYIPISKLSINGFDTHTDQYNNHQRLLKVLDDSIRSLKFGLEKLGMWEDSLILTYSEFGRRAKENGSKGTDHGTANTHFALGGKVKGGFYGQLPSLSDLDGEGNLKYKLDFRAIYASVLNEWFNNSSNQIAKKWKNSSPNFLKV